MHPILIQIGSRFFVGTYGLMLALGLMAGWFVAVRLARRVGMGEHHVMDLAFVAILAGFVGGRAAYIVVDLLPGGPHWFIDHPAQMVFSRTGFVFLGGVCLAIPAVLYYCRRRQLHPWTVGDVVAPAVALGHAFGRIGCFMAGCCYGSCVPTESAFSFIGVRFPKGNDLYPGMAYHDHLDRGLIDSAAVASAPVWPVQLMESAGNLLIAITLLIVWKTRRTFAGQVLLLYLCLYGALRFGLEFLRGDAERGAIGPLSVSQVITLGLIAMAFALWRSLSRKPLPASAVLGGATGENKSPRPASENGESARKRDGGATSPRGERRRHGKRKHR